MKPQIRFKPFVNEWQSKELFRFSKKITNKNSKREINITLTNSAEFGVVNQLDFFDHEITNQSNISGYYVVENNDFVYNPRISASAPVGPINRNMLGYSGVMSPLYYIFRVNGVNEDYLSYFFKTKLWHKFMFENGNTGARFDRLSISDNVLCQMPISMPETNEEQRKIANFFLCIDSLIKNISQKLLYLKQTKIASLQSMFPQQGELVPKVRFKGYSVKWKEVEFGSLLEECLDRSKFENEDILLSSAINGVYLNSELFDHQRGRTNIGYRKIKKNMLILSAQNLHLGNANVNLRFEHGLISPAYKIYYLLNVDPTFMHQWIKRDSTKNFFLNATTAGASLCRKNIVWDDLYKQTLLIPSIEEQQQIGKFFDNLDKHIAIQTQRLEKLKQIKLACLEKMFV